MSVSPRDKGTHIVNWGIYIDGSFNVGFSLLVVFPLSTHTLLASDDPYEFTLGEGLGGVITFSSWQRATKREG